LRPAWEKPLAPPVPADRATEHSFGFPELRVAERYDEPLSYHPIVVDGLVMIAEPTRIRAFELATGTPAWNIGEKNGVPGIIYDTPLADIPLERTPRPRIGIPRYTLNVYEQKLFARLGSPVTVARPDAIDVARDEP